MKRLYTLLLSGLVLAASASVAVPTAMRHIGKAKNLDATELATAKPTKNAGFHKLNGTLNVGVTKKNGNLPIVEFKANEHKRIARINGETISTRGAGRKAVRKAQDFSTYTWAEKGEGKYAASVVAETYGNSTEPVDVKVYEAEGKPGLYKLVGVWPDLLANGELIVDATDPDFVTIPEQDSGIMDDVDGETYIASLCDVYMSTYDYTKEDILEYIPDIVMSVKDNVINIPASAIALRWPNAPEDSKYGTNPDRWTPNQNEGTIVLPGGTYVAPWNLVSDKAQFTENLISPLFTQVQNTEAVDVEVYQKAANPNIYKVVHPLKAFYTAQGYTSTSPDLLLDATDPSNIVIAYTSSGINGGEGVGAYLYYSASYDSESVADEFKITMTEKDGLTTFNFPYRSTYVEAYESGQKYYGSPFASTLVFETPKSDVPESPAGYTVYANGEMDKELNLNYWWNVTLDSQAENPAGEGKVLSSTHTGDLNSNFCFGFQTEKGSTVSGPLHSATLSFQYYATTPCTVTIKLTAVKEDEQTVTVTADDVNKWNTVTFDVTKDFPNVSTEWKDWENQGAGDAVFSAVVENYNADTKVYFNNVAYTNLDTEWKQPEVEAPFCPVPPVPAHAADDVFSLLSGTYPQKMGYSYNDWGSGTSYDLLLTENRAPVIRFGRFNYYGWELVMNIDVADMEYLHVDFYPMAATAFGVTPISPGVDGGAAKEKLYTVAADDVKAEQWNSIDVPLTYFEGVDFSDLFQMKFAGGDSQTTVYMANVYFYKGEPDTPEPGEPIDITGDYIGTFGDYYFEDGIGEYEADVKVVQEGTTVTFEGTNLYYPVKATIDPQTGVISFANENIGTVTIQGTTYYVRFEPTHYEYPQVEGDNGSLVAAPYSATFNPETHEIIFPEDHCFAWVGYSDAEMTKPAGYLDVFDVVKLTWVDPNIDPNEGWTSLGEATFQDGWLLTCPSFKIDHTDRANWYKVELQQNDENENVYRLVDPYKGNSPIAQYNESTKHGYIQFDVTDPDHVVFATDVNAGFTSSRLAISNLYCSSIYSATFELGINEYGLTAEQILAVMNEDYPNYRYSTYKDGIVTVPSWTGEDGIENEAAFGLVAGEIDYHWNDSNKNVVNMEAKIFFPGVDSIRELNAKSEAAPEVYYNLHGQRIAKPTVPGLYIRNNQKIVVR